MNDILWKGMLEDIFEPFLRFFYPKADDLFDFSKGFQFLNQELIELFGEDSSKRHVDKLVKVFTKDGGEEWILIHVEVQGYDDKSFSERMFRYYVNISHKYGKRITAIVIFTDNDPNYKPSMFEETYLGTSIIYRFNTYKILGQSEEELWKSDNPFAMVALTVLLALKAKKLPVQDLLSLKLDLARRLFAKTFDKEIIRSLLSFLRYYVHFDKPEWNDKFEKELRVITKNSNTMGLEEQLLDMAKKKGKEEGREEGREEGIELGLEKSLQVTNLLQKGEFTIHQIAEIAGVSEEFVERVKKALQGKL